MLSVTEQLELSKEIKECEEKLEALLNKRTDFRKELLKSYRLGRVIEQSNPKNDVWKINNHLWDSNDLYMNSCNLRFVYRIKE